MIFCLFGIVLFLAYANGSNDTFKGVATLFGSRTTSYRKALWWAIATTMAGSLTAVLLAGRLVKIFSGKGLVPDMVLQDPAFLMAVGLGAAMTVLLATRAGFPISTTHALVGSLVGTGFVMAGSVDWVRLGQVFFLPLALSPFIGFALTGSLYPVLRWARVHLGIERMMCLCVGTKGPQPVMIQTDGTTILQETGRTLSVDQLSNCTQRYQGGVLGFDSQWMLDRLHFVSAGAVGFARGLNDTPKIVALLMVATGLGISLSSGLFAVSCAMAIGGLLGAKRVGVRMSQHITPMNHGQGFTANFVTAFLVTVASCFGIPVSTTHVSCGSLFGLGAVTGGARWGIIRKILGAWVLTLPIAAVLSAVSAFVVIHLIK